MITFSATPVLVVVIALLILLVVMSTCTFLSRRLSHLRNEERAYEERQRLRNPAQSTEEERQRLRQRLLRHAVDRIVASGAAEKGIPLVSEAQGAEVLADRPLRSQRTRSPNGPGRPMVRLDNGTAVTVTEFVAGVRANGPPPDALPGPTILQMLHDIQQQEREWQSDVGEAQHTVAPDVLWEELHQLDEEDEREAEEKRRAEREALPDAEEVYGKGLPYVLNPANAETVYILDSQGENQKEEERDHQRHLERKNTMKTLEWILTPLLKRKNSVDFDNPGRTVD